MTSRPHCKSPSACSAKGRGHCRSCHAAAAMKANWQDPAFREKQVAASKAHHASKKIEVPGWVPVSLHDEYCEMARASGEEAAASHCRRLKAEMREAAE